MMMGIKCIIISAFLMLVSSAKQTRIIGGDATEEYRYPYAVALTKGSERFFCGGSLIARDVVLTAGHCLGGNYEVAVGRHILADNSTGEIIPMRQEIIHPQWDKFTDEYDFGLVQLDYPTDLEDVSVVSVNKDPYLPRVGSVVKTMGWGDTTMDDEIKLASDVLLDVDVQVISNDDCRLVRGTDGTLTNNYANYIFPSMICTYTPGQDACQGDSGGPLIIPGESDDGSDDIQIGVVSWGIGCARMFPGVYSRVSIAYDWIQETVCEMSQFPPEGLCYTADPTEAPTYFPSYVPTGSPSRRPLPPTLVPTEFSTTITPTITKPPLKKDGTKKEKPMTEENDSQSKTNEMLPPQTDAVKAPDERTVDIDDESNSSAKRRNLNSLVVGFLIVVLIAY